MPAANRVVILLGILAPFAPAAHWDFVPQGYPAYSITSGQIADVLTSNGGFTLQGSNFAVSGGLFSGGGLFGYCFSGCPSGTTYAPNYETQARDGSAVLGGMVYPVVDWSNGL